VAANAHASIVAWPDVPARERVESGTEDHILGNSTFDSLREAVLRITGTHREPGAPLSGERVVEQRGQPAIFVRRPHQSDSDWISEDLRLIVDRLVEGPHDRRYLDCPTPSGLFHLRSLCEPTRGHVQRSVATSRRPSPRSQKWKPSLTPNSLVTLKGS
jgi:hypothetical protein